MPDDIFGERKVLMLKKGKEETDFSRDGAFALGYGGVVKTF